MREFLENRLDNRIDQDISLQSDIFNDAIRTSAMLDVISDKSIEVKGAVEFLTDNISILENSIDGAFFSIEEKIAYLTSSIIHINKIKVSIAATARKIDVKLVNLTNGLYDNMSYSATDRGLIMSTVYTTRFRE